MFCFYLVERGEWLVGCADTATVSIGVKPSGRPEKASREKRWKRKGRGGQGVRERERDENRERRGKDRERERER